MASTSRVEHRGGSVHTELSVIVFLATALVATILATADDAEPAP
jgi:hypothetical protein